uniref:Uncharacterized protein n=1 Tax=Vespula pensylvanica TaxID=30213 RepID=A0A834PFC0_VESPE|nr:hypothetical protein H0235_001015 [Vespula pensylvanica]
MTAFRASKAVTDQKSFSSMEEAFSTKRVLAKQPPISIVYCIAFSLSDRFAAGLSVFSFIDDGCCPESEIIEGREFRDKSPARKLPSYSRRQGDVVSGCVMFHVIQAGRVWSSQLAWRAVNRTIQLRHVCGTLPCPLLSARNSYRTRQTSPKLVRNSFSAASSGIGGSNGSFAALGLAYPTFCAVEVPPPVATSNQPFYRDSTARNFFPLRRASVERKNSRGDIVFSEPGNANSTYLPALLQDVRGLEKAANDREAEFARLCNFPKLIPETCRCTAQKLFNDGCFWVKDVT